MRFFIPYYLINVVILDFCHFPPFNFIDNLAQFADLVVVDSSTAVETQSSKSSIPKISSFQMFYKHFEQIFPIFRTEINEGKIKILQLGALEVIQC